MSPLEAPWRGKTWPSKTSSPQSAVSKKLICLAALALSAAALLAACGKKDTTADRLEAIKSKGEMVIALEGNWAPWSFHDDDGTLVGYDVEVGKAIAEKLGVKATFIEGEWDGLLAGVEAGRYDMVINGVDITDSRKQSYDFSTPYAYIRTALVTRKDNDTIHSFEDLKGKTTANSIGSTYMELAEDYGATCSGVDTLDETIQMVLQGRADATLNADVSFYDYLSQHPDADIQIVSFAPDANEIAIPMQKSDSAAALREAVNKAIENLRTDGTLTELSGKYFGADISSK